MTVAIVVLTPPFLPTLLQSLRVLRFIRLARLLRLAPLFKLAFSFEGVRYATYFSLLVVITSSLGFESAEPNVGYLDSIYWAFGTMTTVGSGDTIPTTDEAKLLAMFVMLVGVGYFAVITGSIAQRFVAFGEEERAEEAVAESAGEDLPARIEQITLRIRELSDDVEALRAAVAQSRADAGN